MGCLHTSKGRGLSMNKLFATAALIAAFIISPMASAGVSGSVGVDSDRFWRGMNMSNGLSTNLNLELDYEGWFVGVDAFKGDELNSMVYGGYAAALTDSLSVRGGIVSYDMDMFGERFEEVVIGGSYKNLDLDYYINADETDSTYFELGYTLPLISIVDLELNYGRFDDGEDVIGFTVSKDVGQWAFSLQVLEEARHGEFMDHASFGVHYNF